MARMKNAHGNRQQNKKKKRDTVCLQLVTAILSIDPVDRNLPDPLYRIYLHDQHEYLSLE